MPWSTSLQADPAGNRRRDVAVGQVQLGVVHDALVLLHHPLVLRDERPLRVDLLLRDGVLRRKRDVAVEVDLRLLELGLRLEELALGLLQRRLVGARIDDGEHVALVHHLALGELDLGQSPLICVRTVAVARGVTVPSPFRMTSMSPFRATFTTTGSGPIIPKRPPPRPPAPVGIAYPPARWAVCDRW